MRQEQKTKKCSVSVTAWGLAAVGMTLLAVSPFFPPLAIPGMVIATVAGALKLSELIIPFALGYSARKKYQNNCIKKTLAVMQTTENTNSKADFLGYMNDKNSAYIYPNLTECGFSEESQEKLKSLWDVLKKDFHLNDTDKNQFFYYVSQKNHEDQTAFLNDPLNYLTRKDQAKARMAYELSYPDTNDSSDAVEKSYYQNLLSLDKKTRAHLLDSALDKCVENKIIDETLGNRVTANGYKNTLSQKSKGAIVSSYFLDTFKNKSKLADDNQIDYSPATLIT